MKKMIFRLLSVLSLAGCGEVLAEVGDEAVGFLARQGGMRGGVADRAADTGNIRTGKRNAQA